MTATTETPDRTLAKLPSILRVSISPDLAKLCPSLADSIKRRDDMTPKASAARSDFEQKLKALKEARDADREALAQAAIDGKPDPGRKHEAKAIRELDEAHRIAEGLIVAANRTTRGIASAMKGDEGLEAIRRLDEQIAAKAVDVSEAAAETRACLGELAKLEAYKGQIVSTRKMQPGPYSPVANAPVRGLEVSGNVGRNVSAGHILEQLIDIKPEIES